MSTLRLSLREHRWLALLLLGAALCLKAVLPSGIMVESRGMVLAISICFGATGEQLTRQITVPMKQEPAAQDADAKGACHYASLAMSGLLGAGPALLTLATAFIVALGFAPRSRPAARRIVRWRPPMRAPPAAG